MEEGLGKPRLKSDGYAAGLRGEGPREGLARKPRGMAWVSREGSLGGRLGEAVGQGLWKALGEAQRQGSLPPGVLLVVIFSLTSRKMLFSQSDSGVI